MSNLHYVSYTVSWLVWIPPPVGNGFFFLLFLFCWRNISKTCEEHLNCESKTGREVVFVMWPLHLSSQLLHFEALKRICWKDFFYFFFSSPWSLLSTHLLHSCYDSHIYIYTFNFYTSTPKLLKHNLKDDHKKFC